MVFRASKAKPSQLDRCLTASPPDVFVLSNAQISSFRPLVRPIFLHNFLTKYPYNPIVVPCVPACLARHHSNLQSGFMMLDARALSVLSCANRLRRWPLGLRTLISPMRTDSSSRICCSFFSFLLMVLWAYRFQTDFFAYQGRVTLSSSLLNEAG